MGYMGNAYFVESKSGMDYTLKAGEGITGRYLKKQAMKVRVAAQAQAGMHSGALKMSINVSQERTATGQVVRIGSSLPYALLHHEGTRPHMITGRNGGMLRFTASGRVVYSRAVLHPGTRPNKYLSDNLWLFLT